MKKQKSYEVCLNLTNLFGFPKEWNLAKVSSISQERIGQPKLNDIVKQAIELTNFSGKKKKELISSKSNEIQDFEYYDDMGDTSHMDTEELDKKPNLETIAMKVEDSESYLNAEELKSMEWALEKYNKGQQHICLLCEDGFGQKMDLLKHIATSHDKI